MQDLPDLRFLRGDVYGELHELPDRMALRGNGTVPAVYSARLELAKRTGMAIMRLLREDLRPRDVMTASAFENALTVDMALGCSTNSMLHLPAIANECGISIDLDHANARRRDAPTSTSWTKRAGCTRSCTSCPNAGCCIRIAAP